MNVKRGSTTFLKVIIFLAGIGVLALCMYWLPMATVRDAKVHPDTADFLIPFLVWSYGLCITFSIALYQVFKLLTYIEKNMAFSELSLKALNSLKNCAFSVIFFLVLGIAILKVLSTVTGDDAAGPTSLSLMGILLTSIVATFITVLQKPINYFLEKNEIKL
ncbi:hypothetical protein CN918_29820 [Priestia megaterium]|nr:hypothetical protein CN918_29820 [Priestia megaterium]